jgi:2-polyprenyl-6-methoxyphenol hydroxylase-like FAD-dependent oxidoreductase
MTKGDSELDALVVGAGPTGLALATQLQTFGARFRIIDRLLDRTRESRALGVQARTLELLRTLGLGEQLVARGMCTRRPPATSRTLSAPCRLWCEDEEARRRAFELVAHGLAPACESGWRFLPCIGGLMRRTNERAARRGA